LISSTPSGKFRDSTLDHVLTAPSHTLSQSLFINYSIIFNYSFTLVCGNILRLVLLNFVIFVNVHY
jgi:hypothetical protein